MEITIKGEKREVEIRELTRKQQKEIDLCIFGGREVNMKDLDTKNPENSNFTMSMEDAEKQKDLMVAHSFWLSLEEVWELLQSDYNKLFEIVDKKK